MVGGATSGYWAIGSCDRATVPTMTMTTDSTVAKIGRSMKKCESIGLLRCGTVSRCGRSPDRATVGRPWHSRREAQQATRPPPVVLSFLVGWFSRCARHGSTLGLDFRPVAHPLDAVHDDPVPRLHALRNYLQPIAQPAELDVASFDHILVVDNVNELAALVGPDRSFGDHQRLAGIADGNPDASAH